MTAATATPLVRTEGRSRANEIWRIVRLHTVNPSIFFGIPWIILGGAWAITMALALIVAGASGAPADDILTGFRYSWAVLSPQWYLVVVGVQAISFTFSFALGFGATRRDYWLGTSIMFVLVAVEMAAAIATLVQLEKATNGWWVGAGMFDALWYGQSGWLFDFYTSFALQMFVLFVGAGVTTVYMRWRMKGMLTLGASLIVVVLGALAIITGANAWPSVWAWFASIGLLGVFTITLGLALVCAVGGYLVIRRATPR
ncbi:hypothetical protein BJ978_001297 [Agromyces terreus]|uniref:Uncharacterized protein n=1 Tax=Agromyces terreus TaxID=424795 RepID=A0A9X2GZY7_9MICO|nr:hypothetical protein [Agromyces terreus]MCP2370621.1 hypothetical protein [Agromyces terreus]